MEKIDLGNGIRHHGLESGRKDPAKLETSRARLNNPG
jgi:hypothetical protein